jgi:hypothetical protein
VLGASGAANLGSKGQQSGRQNDYFKWIAASLCVTNFRLLSQKMSINKSLYFFKVYNFSYRQPKHLATPKPGTVDVYFLCRGTQKIHRRHQKCLPTSNLI